MGDPEQAEVRRVLEATALKARTDAERYARKLREKPFWRFRRRQALNRALAAAEEREQAALHYLNDGQG